MKKILMCLVFIIYSFIPSVNNEVSTTDKNNPAPKADIAAKLPEKTEVEFDVFKDEKAINLCYIVDQDFIKFLKTSISSVNDKSSPKDKFNIYIFESGLSDNDKKDIISVGDTKKCKFVFINFKLDDYKSRTTAFVPNQSYIKMVITEKLPKVKKILYLSSTTIVLGSLKDIWETDISNSFAAVVEDVSLEKHNNWVIEKKAALFPEKYAGLKKIFSTDFMLLNLEMIKKEKIREKFESEKFNDTHHLQDDIGVLNTLFNNKVIFLPINTNMSYEKFVTHNSFYKKFTQLSDAQINLAKKKPLTVSFSRNDIYNTKNPYIFKLIKYAKSRSLFNILNEMHVALITDNKHAKITATTIASILDSANNSDLYYFYIFETDLNKSSKDKINSLKCIRNFKVKYININPKFLKSLPKNKYKIIYVLADIPNLVNDVDKILFINSGVIVRNSLFELYNTNLSDKFAVVIPQINNFFEGENAKDFSENVILLNNQKYRNEDIKKKFFDELKSDPKLRVFDIFKKIFKESVIFSQIKWDISPSVINFEINDKSKKITLRDEEISYMKAYPSIISFNKKAYKDKNYKFYKVLKYYKNKLNWNSGSLNVWESEDPYIKEYSFKNTNIKVAYFIDKEQIPFVAASIASILKNAHPTDSFKFYIFENGITLESKFNINELKKIKNFNIEYISYDEKEFLKDKQCDNEKKKKFYMDCFGFNLIVNSLSEDKVIILNPVSIVRTSLQEFYNFDIEYKFATAVQHQGVNDLINTSHFYRGRPINFYEFINSGVMCLNLNMCRIMNIPDKINYEIKYSNHEFVFMSLLNIIFINKLRLVPPVWNLTYQAFENVGGCARGVLRDPNSELFLARENPNIINFEVNSYMLLSNNSNPFSFELFHYLSITAWHNMVHFLNVKPKPIIQIKEVEVPQVIIKKENGVVDSIKESFLNFFKRKPAVSVEAVANAAK